MIEELEIPSKRIRFALEAMKEVEDKDGFQIYMAAYRIRDDDNICYACCGGAARLKLMDFSFVHQSELLPDLFEGSLDSARCGDIGEMFVDMDLDVEEGEKFNRSIPPYDSLNTEPFYTAMEALANDLEQAGY